MVVAGTSCNGSQLICREAPVTDGASAGYGLLVRHGYVVELGPGLVSGLPLFQRTMSRLAERCRQTFAALSAQEVSLPASEGAALINLLIHGGVGQRSDLVAGFAVGAGFRHGGPPPRGLYDMPLYQRFDAAVVAAAEQSPGDWMSTAIEGLLASLELPLSHRDAGDDGVELVVALAVEGESVPTDEVVGRLRQGVLDGTGRELSLLSLDLCAVVCAAAHVHGDEVGLAWPSWMAPFDVGLMVVNPSDGEACALAEKLRVDLLAAGLDVLVEDRPLDAAARRVALTSWGLPLRVLAGPTANKGEVLLEDRRLPGPPERVPAGELLARISARLGRPLERGTAPLRRRATY